MINTNKTQNDADQANHSARSVAILRVQPSGQSDYRDDVVAVEEPLELRLRYGPANARITRSLSVTMRTPGDDEELVAGFLLTEGILTEAADIEHIHYVQGSDARSGAGTRNSLQVTLVPAATFNLATLERNFYTTSSCGICGKASLLALRSVCPPRSLNQLPLAAELIQQLPAKLRAAQQVFHLTGGLHACGLFDRLGNLLTLREDVGRHNACDKVIGREFLADRTPLRDHILLLSGRASFELLQKSVMGGISAVISVGAPSSLAVQVAKDFDVTLIGFVREHSFNVYHGFSRVHAPVDIRMRDED